MWLREFLYKHIFKEVDKEKDKDGVSNKDNSD